MGNRLHPSIIAAYFFIWSVLALVTTHVNCSSSSGSSQWSLGEISDPNRSAPPPSPPQTGVTLNDAMAEMQCAMRLMAIMRTMCQIPRPPRPISATLLPQSSAAERGSSDDDEGQASELLMTSCDAPLQAAVRLCATQPSLPIFGGQQRPFYWPFDRFAARGRRQDNNNILSEYPPGFFAARGRRNGPNSDQDQQLRERKGDNEDEFPTLYVRGFLGSRG